MLELVLAMLAGALIMGVAIEVYKLITEYDNRARAERDRAVMRRSVKAYEERDL